MPLKIDATTADSLTLRIGDAISKTAVFFGLDLVDFDWADEIAKTLPSGLTENLVGICGEKGLGDFVYGQVLRRTQEAEDFGGDTSYLSEVKSFADPIALGREIVSELRALPYSYRLTAVLPSIFSDDYYDDCQNFDLGRGLSIRSGAELEDHFPLSSDVERRDKIIAHASGGEKTLSLDPKALYLVQQKSGYVAGQQESPVSLEFKNTLRQFLGAALAVGAIKSGGWGADKSIGVFVIHKQDDGYELISGERFSPQIQDFYGKMHRPRTKDSKEPRSKVTATVREQKLNAIKSVFAATDHGKRLSVASIWYLRSYLSHETLDGLLESTIALEALLGGGNAEGTKLSSLLGNRCAYLIGKTLKDRDEILSQFTEIYKLRSKIVHEGHHKFSSHERSLLVYSRELCRRAMIAEMRLLAHEK